MPHPPLSQAQGPAAARRIPLGVIAPMCIRGLAQSLCSVLAGLGIIFLIFTFMALFAPEEVRAEDRPQSGTANKKLLAGLYFNAELEDKAFKAPEARAEVEITVAGQVQRVKVRQYFQNPSDLWLEGLYVFPLPEKSAVDRLKMIVGGRIVEGKIMEREAAKRSYEKAKAAGRKASLLTAERANVFTTSLANIGPGEEIVVEIEYQDTVRYQNGLFELRFPMVVAPRYMPSDASLAAADKKGAAPLHALSGKDGEGRDLFGPVRHPLEGPANPLALAIELDTGFRLESLRSLYHKVTIDTLEDGRQRITLADGVVPADRDFVLEWQAQEREQPEAVIFAEEVSGDSHLLVQIFPADLPAKKHGEAEKRQAILRDLVFIIDTSGSMHGASLDQAKSALLRALSGLKPEDRFNVIQFNSKPERLFGSLKPANAQEVRKAWRYVSALEADGGTEMKPALSMALAEEPKDGRLLQLIFLTDGAVGNEHELLKQITRSLGERRLFTIAIGSAPNSYFMRTAAEAGRGSFTYIGDVKEVGERMKALFAKLENPALTDLALSLEQGGFHQKPAELYPNPIPDLYEGEPVTFALRLQGQALSTLEGRLHLSGLRGGKAWEETLDLADLRPAPGVASLWAREKIHSIEAGLRRGENPSAVRAKALEVALTHRLVTPYSSLVAIDDQPSRPAGQPLSSREIVRNLPANWNWEKVFGELERSMDLAPLPKPLLHKISGKEIMLPASATPAALKILTGILILLAGLFLILLKKRCMAAQSHREF